MAGSWAAPFAASVEAPVPFALVDVEPVTAWVVAVVVGALACVVDAAVVVPPPLAPATSLVAA
jgi:hypothetical protein